MSRGQSQRIAVRAAVVGQGNLHNEAAKRWSGDHLRVEDRQAADDGRDERSGEPELERSLATAAAEHQGARRKSRSREHRPGASRVQTPTPCVRKGRSSDRCEWTVSRETGAQPQGREWLKKATGYAEA